LSSPTGSRINANRALALAANRNWATALSHIGRCKTYLGLFDEAIAAQQKALRLNPRDAEQYYYRIGEAHLLQSHIPEAIIWLEKARSANPKLPIQRSHLASAYALNGDLDRAVTELAEVRRLSGNLSGNFSSIARVREAMSTIVAAPAIRNLAETTYLAGLRKAGMPEE
jgi:tetratricopeptide (TPR) repeat protein